LTACFLAAAAGCSDTHVLSGAFGTGEDAPLTLPGANGLERQHMELVLGHYGPDVAGLAWFCQEGACAARTCSHIEFGSWSDGNLRFVFTPPNGCEATVSGTCAVSGTLTLEGDSVLRGTLSLAGGEPVQVTLKRTKYEGELVRDDVECPARETSQ